MAWEQAKEGAWLHFSIWQPKEKPRLLHVVVCTVSIEACNQLSVLDKN
jgi:hypothetical protein